MSRRRFAALAASAGLVLVLALAGCGSGASPSPPTGVDGLTIPTPSPAPADFVPVVDNPWFPLPVGARWGYAVPGLRRGPTIRVSTGPGPVVQGVATTSVRTLTRRPGDHGTSEVVDLYAQDRAGNVWWFGHQIITSADQLDVPWRAGVGGAEAGLVVPAEPRMGDGFRSALQVGQVDERATVVSTLAELAVPFGHYPETLVIDTDDAVHHRVVRRYYAAGVGLVEQQSLIGLLNQQIVLVSRTP